MNGQASRGGWVVNGEPRSFLTSGEAAWKARVRESAADFRIGANEGLQLEFVVSAWRRRGHSFDVDNLAKPVLDVLGRPEVRFVEVTAKMGSPPGVGISVSSELPSSPPSLAWMPDLILGSVRHSEVHPALQKAPRLVGEGPLSIHLLVHEAGSITDFDFTGFVKPTIDRLWPILGGTPGRPHDHRIRELVVRYSAERASGVTICAAEIEERQDLPRVASMVSVSPKGKSHRTIAPHDLQPRHGDYPTSGLMVSKFIDDEKGYLAWIARYPQGFVLNTYRNPSPRYLTVHRASCVQIGTPWRKNYTTGSYVKVCSVDKEGLEMWVSSEVGGTMKVCNICLPA